MTADTAIKIWALVGPLVGAAISAWWNRRIQLQDREHQDSLELKRHEYSIAVKELDHRRDISKENVSRLKVAYVDFVASANEYALHSSNNLRTPNSELREIADKALAALNRNYHLVTILGSSKVGDLATDTLNLALDIGSGEGKEDGKLHDAYRNSKAKLVAAVRECIEQTGA